MAQPLDTYMCRDAAIGKTNSLHTAFDYASYRDSGRFAAMEYLEQYMEGTVYFGTELIAQFSLCR
jgi:hypothetical protein